ncbi:TetR/AcrR family transcriptional regulator C-terminal domain-containing protein [Frondihabitans sp. 4ASC-45]|uniref:TetR/AcrR family transcriptional regulator C-terminal domain-containing protein n=1 Tax=Frondihabitans sp. 4ASC-45 TaxID=3111636 RepID=UPI003C161A5D
MTSPGSSAPALPDARATIDEAARTIALSSGLTAITLRRMASVSSLSPGVIAAEEPSMHALAARTFSDLALSELGRVRAVAAAASTPLEALRILVSALLATDHCLSKTIWADAWSIGRHNDFVAVAARECMTTWQELAVSILDAGNASGDFHVTNAPLAARQFFALIDSTTVYGLVGYLTEEERSQLVTRSVEVSVGLVEGTLAGGSLEG